MGWSFLIPIFGILTVLVPIIGVTTILTLRLGGKPFVETLARELGGAQSGTELQLRVRELEDQVESLASEMHELRTAQSFDQRLIGSRATEETAVLSADVPAARG